MVIRTIYLFICIMFLFLLKSCSTNITYNYPSAKIFGIWKLDSFITNQKNTTENYKEYSYEFTGDENLFIRKNSTTITANCIVFNTSYTNYIIVSHITDSNFIRMKKKWFIGEISQNRLRLDYKDLNIENSIYFNR